MSQECPKVFLTLEEFIKKFTARGYQGNFKNVYSITIEETNGYTITYINLGYNPTGKN